MTNKDSLLWNNTTFGDEDKVCLEPRGKEEQLGESYVER